MPQMKEASRSSEIKSKTLLSSLLLGHAQSEFTVCDNNKTARLIFSLLFCFFLYAVEVTHSDKLVNVN